MKHARPRKGWHDEGMTSAAATGSSWTAEDIPSQVGRTIVITGANSGLGFASAVALAQHGARIVLACRDPERGLDALESVRDAAADAEPLLLKLDLADLDSVEAAAEELAESVDHVDVLMNNAGVMALPLRRTAQGHEMQFGTNHLGHYAFTGHVLPLLLAAPDPRVVTTSSQMHRLGKMAWTDLDWNERRYQRWPAYGQSKLANLQFAYELARRAHNMGTSLKSVAAHPGYASTGLQQVGPTMAGRRITARIMNLGNRIAGQEASNGALPQLFAATSPQARSGAYYGPDGLGQMRGAPTEVTSSAAARSRDEAHRLWNLSEEMTGFTYEWNAQNTSASG